MGSTRDGSMTRTPRIRGCANAVIIFPSKRLDAALSVCQQRCYFSIFRTPQQRVNVILRRYELPFVSGPGSAETSFFHKAVYLDKGIRGFFVTSKKKKQKYYLLSRFFSFS